MTAPFSCRSAHHDVQHALQPEWLAIPADVRGHHAQLLAIAYDLADGGRIAGARRWPPTLWERRAGFHPRYQVPRLEQHNLVHWEGDDLCVHHYNRNHEERLRWLWKRGPELTDIRLGRQSGADPTAQCTQVAPPLNSRLGGGYSRVNCAKVLKTPTTVPSTVPSTDSGSAPIHPERSPAGSRPPLRTRPDSGPPDQPEDRARVTDGGGPEGFERWWSAMPVPRERQPRDPRVWPAWRERCLLLWVREDLEGEADEILAELERRKRSTAWTETPGYIPSGYNFLRAASWRDRRRAPPPAPAGTVEVYAPVPWPAGAKFKDYLKELADRKVLS